MEEAIGFLATIVISIILIIVLIVVLFIGFIFLSNKFRRMKYIVSNNFLNLKVKIYSKAGVCVTKQLNLTPKFNYTEKRVDYVDSVSILKEVFEYIKENEFIAEDGIAIPKHCISKVDYFEEYYTGYLEVPKKYKLIEGEREITKEEYEAATK